MWKSRPKGLEISWAGERQRLASVWPSGWMTEAWACTRPSRSLGKGLSRGQPVMTAAPAVLLAFRFASLLSACEQNILPRDQGGEHSCHNLLSPVPGLCLQAPPLPKTDAVLAAEALRLLRAMVPAGGASGAVTDPMHLIMQQPHPCWKSGASCGFSLFSFEA